VRFVCARADRRRSRIIAFSVYAAALTLYWLVIGMPTDIIAIAAWLFLATVCWNIAEPRRQHLAFLRDWVPIVLALELYDMTRGLADNGIRPHVTEMLAADRWMAQGTVPTVWLQQHFYDPTAAHWWDAIVSTVYFSHFLATPVIAVVLWLRNRDLWLHFVRRWLALIAAGLATYVLFPAAPPWWAAQAGLIAPVDRMSSRGWQALGLHSAGNVLASAQDLANPVAAMPSLHAAFSMLVTAFVITRVGARWRPLIALYPIAMGLSLVYAGEHWVTDILVGWAYVLVILVVVAAAERAWAGRRQPAMGLSNVEPLRAHGERVSEAPAPAASGGAGNARAAAP
jgi:membrane-associated phospholipid phosphatase